MCVSGSEPYCDSGLRWEVDNCSRGSVLGEKTLVGRLLVFLQQKIIGFSSTNVNAFSYDIVMSCDDILL